VPEYRKTKTAGVYVRHQARRPAAGGEGARCRCEPSYRGRRWDPGKQEMVWSATFRDRAEVLSWLGATLKGREAVAEAEAAGPTFRELADEWLDGVHTGAVARRRGKKGTGYSLTTLHGYERSLRYVLTPEFGGRPACEIDDREWQTWVDRLSREGLCARVSRTTWPWRARSTAGRAARPAGSSSATRSSASSCRRTTRSRARESPTPTRPRRSLRPWIPPTRFRTP
jgi:hypothetical protein